MKKPNSLNQIQNENYKNKNPKSNSHTPKNNNISHLDLIPLPKNYSSNIQNIFNNIYNDDFVLLINQLSTSIKTYYHLNNQNINNMKELLKNENELKEINNNPLEQNLNKIENSFNNFFNTAKVLFKRMKNYRNEKIEDILNKAEMMEKVNKKNTKSLPKNNNVNITNCIIKNDLNLNGNINMVINNNENKNSNKSNEKYKKNETLNLKKENKKINYVNNNNDIINFIYEINKYIKNFPDSKEKKIF
jgi:hypothetical protein